jgi:hypothetical protein
VLSPNAAKSLEDLGMPAGGIAEDPDDFDSGVLR